ncbi:odorant receptor 261 [Nasonia vitripennis]|uniref:Odorant receptor n=1 Tax=Nasonia vitripennis TaxID=7425 RepID=A0A7M6UGE0_NASVI|nr:odorant receptor 261 [Nasonia vitripennis]
MEAKLAKYARYRNVVRRLLLLSGIWPHLEDTCRLYRVLTFSATFVIAALGAKVFAYCIDNIAHVSLFAKGMSNAFSFYTSVLCYLVYRKDLVMLNDCLGRRFEDELKREDRRPLLLQSISVYTRFMCIVAGLTATALVFYTLVPLVFIFKYKKLTQIYQGRYPFAVEPGGRVYWCVCFVESISVVFVWNVVCSVDNAFGLHSFRMCGLLRSLADRFAKLQPDDPGYIVELRDCVRTHQLVLRAKEALQRVYGLVVLWTYVTSAIIMCSILYQADQAKKHMTVTRVIFFTSYITLKLLQSFTYAYYGSLVSQESEKCQNAIYTSNWPGSGDLRLMKDVLIIQSQRPIVLRANGFFIVSMEMFEKIVNTTISYFFLLQAVEEK